MNENLIELEDAYFQFMHQTPVLIGLIIFCSLAIVLAIYLQRQENNGN